MLGNDDDDVDDDDDEGFLCDAGWLSFVKFQLFWLVGMNTFYNSLFGSLV